MLVCRLLYTGGLIYIYTHFWYILSFQFWIVIKDSLLDFLTICSTEKEGYSGGPLFIIHRTCFWNHLSCVRLVMTRCPFEHCCMVTVSTARGSARLWFRCYRDRVIWRASFPASRLSFPHPQCPTVWVVSKTCRSSRPLYLKYDQRHYTILYYTIAT